jgi:hypothetical protein
MDLISPWSWESCFNADGSERFTVTRRPEGDAGRLQPVQVQRMRAAGRSLRPGAGEMVKQQVEDSRVRQIAGSDLNGLTWSDLHASFPRSSRRRTAGGHGSLPGAARKHRMKTRSSHWSNLRPTSRYV